MAPLGTAAKVLIVDAQARSREALANALTIAGFEVASAPSGSAALSMLEWECPDIIVSCAKVNDMDGYELFTQVRKDATTIDTPFLLLAGRDRPTALAAAEAGVDLVVSGDIALDVVVAHVADLLKNDASAAARPIRRIEFGTKKKAVEPLWAALDTAAAKSGSLDPGSVGGSLDVMDLAEITQAIALGGKTGTLTVGFSAGEGSMLFEVGRLVHATFTGKTGEAAFAALIQASQRETQASFRFSQTDRGELARVPRTIARSVDQLLLSIAAGIDEGGASSVSAHPTQ